MTEQTQTEETAGEEIQLVLKQRRRMTLSQQLFGITPYVIIRPNNSEDVGVIELSIEAGGGAKLAEIAGLFADLGVLLAKPDVVQQMEAATEAAIDDAQDDDED